MTKIMFHVEQIIFVFNLYLYICYVNKAVIKMKMSSLSLLEIYCEKALILKGLPVTRFNLAKVRNDVFAEICRDLNMPFDYNLSDEQLTTFLNSKL